jgi:hypothetical protein
VSVDPWPFDAPRFDLPILAKAIPACPCTTDAQLNAMIGAAVTETLVMRLSR